METVHDPMAFFADADSVAEQNAAGQLDPSWPLEGQATLLAVKTDIKKGAPYIVFVLQHDKKGTKDFLVRLPKRDDKDTAKFMAMKSIYATLYSVADLPTTSPISEAFQASADFLKDGAASCRYQLREWNSFNPTTGNTFKNQNLEAIFIEEQF